MDVTGVVLKQPQLCFSKHLLHFSSSASVVPVPGLYDRGSNLKYRYCNRGYSSYAVAHNEKQELKKTKKTKKKQTKLLKGLFKDLSVLSEMNFGLKADGDLLDQVKGNMIADAAEHLIEQLQKLRAEEKELKRKKKEEKMRLKAVQMQNRLILNSEISDSESNSDSEEVVDMKSRKHAHINHNAMQPIIDEAKSQPKSAPVAEKVIVERDVNVMPSSNLDTNCCFGTGSNGVNLGDARDHSKTSLDPTICSKKIKVCMGGKCKKSGAAALLERFQRVVGIEGAVTGCKCMGKCRDGPNVRVLNGYDEGFGDHSVRSPGIPLCTGVRMEDVDFIVANFLGEFPTQRGFAAT